MLSIALISVTAIDELAAGHMSAEDVAQTRYFFGTWMMNEALTQDERYSMMLGEARFEGALSYHRATEHYSAMQDLRQKLA